MDKSSKYSRLIYWGLLVVGFAGLAILACPGLGWLSGVAAAAWILAFLGFTCRFRSKRDLGLGAAVFCVGYLIRYTAAVDLTWLYLLLFPAMALVIYGIFLLYAFLLNKRSCFAMTLAFPAIWIAVYGIATLIRFPSLLRIDILFTDLKLLIQSERFIGSAGLSFVILWFFALVHFAIRNKHIISAVSAAVLSVALIVTGIICLYPNSGSRDSVRVAYTTGPDIGDYIDYTVLPIETYLANTDLAVETAAAQGADILVFSEEAFELTADEEESFLEDCCATAREHGIHLLIGLDVGGITEDAARTNKLVWIDPTGNILGSYCKAKLLPILESGYQPGDGSIPSHTIDVNGKPLNVSYLICYDSNFPSYVRQIDDETDILFLPSWDWPAVTEPHSKICRTIAVENRVNIVKCTYDGISIVANPDGSVLHQTDTAKDGFGTVHIVDIPYDSGSSAAEQTADN